MAINGTSTTFLFLFFVVLPCSPSEESDADLIGLLGFRSRQEADRFVSLSLRVGM